MKSNKSLYQNVNKYLSNDKYLSSDEIVNALKTNFSEDELKRTKKFIENDVIKYKDVTRELYLINISLGECSLNKIELRKIISRFTEILTLNKKQKKVYDKINNEVLNTLKGLKTKSNNSYSFQESIIYGSVQYITYTSLIDFPGVIEPMLKAIFSVGKNTQNYSDNIYSKINQNNLLELHNIIIGY